MSTGTHLQHRCDDKVISTLFIKLFKQTLIQHDLPFVASDTLRMALEKPQGKIDLLETTKCLSTNLLDTEAGIGLAYGKQLSVIAADGFGQLLMTSETLEDAFNHLNHFRLLFGVPCLFELEPTSLDAHQLKLSVTHHSKQPEALKHFICEALLSTIQQQSSWLCGKALKFNCVSLPFEKPSHAKLYEDYFQCEIHFEQSTLCAEFDSNYLSYPILTANPAINRCKLAECNDAIKKCEKRISIQKRLFVLFDQQIPNLPCIDQAAEQLQLSKSALHRKLSEEDTSYQQTLNKFKQQKSENLLKNTDYTISEIAERIGFSDSSTFRRAFKTWTGQQPSKLRKHYQTFP